MTIEERIDEATRKVGETLGDGFQNGDIAILIQEAVEVADAIGDLHDLDGPEKKKIALRLLGNFIDLAEPHILKSIDLIIDQTDGPGPDAIIDPIAKTFAPSIVIGALRHFAPGLIDLVVEASAGRVKVNQETA